jgi:HPt (histidine-containing phosphotransfer) domain-containing protein
MNERNIEERMCRLIEQLQSLPSEYREKLEKLCQHDGTQRSQIEESVAKLQDSLDYLRLSVKYIVFDLEATRRENVYLRKLVEQIRRDSTRQDDRDDRDDSHFFGNDGAD